jgi:hypothetical protein
LAHDDVDNNFETLRRTLNDLIEDVDAITAGTLANVTTSNLKVDNISDNAVDTAQIADDAVTVDKLAANSVGAAQIIDGSLSLSDLAGGGALNATTSADGFMSSADKTKLDSVATSANLFVHPTHPGDDFDQDTGPLSAFTVVSDIDINLATDTLGHVTEANCTISTRDFGSDLIDWLAAEVLPAIEASQSHISNHPSIPDAGGTSRTISEAYTGFVALRVNQSGSVNHVDGPNARTFTSANISSDQITIADHGLEENTRVKIQSGTGSTAPTGLSYNTLYYANVVDADTIKLKSSSGGSTVAISGGSGDQRLERDIIVAFNASDWVSTGSSAYYIPTVNYQFKHFLDAYVWFVKYAGSTNLILLASDSTSVNCLWNNGGRVIKNIGGGTSFEYLDQLKIFGYLDGPGGKLAGGSTSFDGSDYSYLYPYDRCRIIFSISDSNDFIPIWLRGPKSVYMYSVVFDFKIAAGTTVPFQQGIRFSDGIFTLSNVHFTLWSSQSVSSAHGSNSNNTGSLAYLAEESGIVYHLQGHCVAYGFGTGWMGSERTGTVELGAPSNTLYTYQKNVSISSSWLRRQYNAYYIQGVAQSVFLNNATGDASPTGLGTQPSAGGTGNGDTF